MGAEAAGEASLETPLYDTHVTYKGKVVPFVGRLLPVQYETGVIEEYMAVRTKYGLFDILYTGEVIYKGLDAPKNLNMSLINGYAVMAEGQTGYSPMCNEQGGVVGDLIVYKVRDDYYFIVVNTTNKDKGYVWMKAYQSRGVVFDDISSQMAQPALQGPKAMDMLKKMVKEEGIPEKYYTYLFDRTVGGMKCAISKTGCTGEDGVEIYLVPKDAPEMWKLLVKAGKSEDLVPCGLGVRDTLRLEAGMPLYGHKTGDTISPKEAGLGIFVKMDKDDSIGKQVTQGRGPLTREHVGLKVAGHGIIREHQPIYIGEQ